MNYAKIAEDLRQRASRTTFTNEREICLNMLAKLILSGKIEATQKIEDEIDVDLHVSALRPIFIERFFPLYYFEIDEGYVPFNFTPYDYTAISDLAARESSQISSMLGGALSDKYLKFLSTVKQWAKEQKQIFHSYPEALRWVVYHNNFVEVTPEFLHWMSPQGSKQQDIDKSWELFEKRRTEFENEVNSGEYDKIIKELFNPTLLEN